ncbi:MAG: polyhydroxyalkanoate synthesis regulator DNA-binding domain-containing protein [Candidatus Cyclonatronum sp.]|uniref:polyhydroxyalkanoate synthesis regulator DNA-binding domain-containing protein n=1 Tax=Cyclonatronum sp. TaxID=3024185 RepID=UPI0025C51B96|nr:polyhydroxyalkanoate synthesis regulator DNA-binding domain-containing protein [Cyclonatronum sp.]MCC5934353.1 polyhydroxyalkanoate synthesis regulator DNA-binding domain-containing protein [Balneolales bacterium]MCH8485839.1 polyhydroxyalkanoate synthesis regulator DNA-binding domain-containing protein [Cyclonatronum sp.]
MKRTIKKYGNRKLYDSAESRYISMTELKQIIRDGEDVEVIDTRTGNDITSEVLTKAIVEAGGKDGLSPDALHSLIRWGTTAFESGLAFLGRSLHKVLPLADRADVKGLMDKVRTLEGRVEELQQQLRQQENQSSSNGKQPPVS